MGVLLILYIALAIVGYKLKVTRTKMPKLSNFLVWFLIIGFGIAYFVIVASRIGNQDIYEMLDIDDLIYECCVIFTVPVLVILELVILLVLNILTISSKGKAVLLSVTQVATSFIVPVALILLFVLVFFGGYRGNTNSPTSDSTGYSYDQNNEARNKGYSNALDAERSGRKWNGSTWE